MNSKKSRSTFSITWGAWAHPARTFAQHQGNRCFPLKYSFRMDFEPHGEWDHELTTHLQSEGASSITILKKAVGEFWRVFGSVRVFVLVHAIDSGIRPALFPRDDLAAWLGNPVAVRSLAEIETEKTARAATVTVGKLGEQSAQWSGNKFQWSAN